MPFDPVAKFPTALDDDLPDPTAATYTDDEGYELDRIVVRHNNIHEAVEAKVGIGVSTPTPGAALVGATTAGRTTYTPIQRKNRLPNGLFRHWTRGTSGPTVADNAYGPDGCRILTETTTTGFVVSREITDVPSGGSHDAVKLAIGASNNTKNGIFLPIEGRDMWDMRGGVASAQFKMKVSDARIGDVRIALCQWTGTEDAISADPISAWGAALTNPTLIASWGMINTPSNYGPTTSWLAYVLENQSVSASATNLALFIWIDDKTTTAGDYLLVTDAQVEKGAICTDVERPSFTETLQQCRRYVRGWGGLALQVAGYGFAVSDTSAIISKPLSPPMRAIPTISFGGSAATQWCVQKTAGTRVTLTDLVVEGSTGDVQDITLTGTVASGLGTVGGGVRLMADNNAAARFYLSAEL